MFDQLIYLNLSISSKKREIESVKEEITNLNFIHAQTESTIESLTKTYENLNGNVDNFSKESQLKLVQYHDKLELIKRQMNGIQNKFRDYDAEKNSLTKKINEAKVQSNDLINNAMEKIQMFQKNEAFAKTIVISQSIFYSCIKRFK
jgi:chromosome segregation ATPase